MEEQLRFLAQIVERLERLGVPYMLTGSVALALYAEPRMTRDLDLVVDLEAEDVEGLAALFAKDCYLDRDEAQDAVHRRGMFNAIHKESLVKADFIVRKDDPYRKTEFDRRRSIDVEGMALSVVAPEDLLLSKLHWAKEAQSELQIRDAREIAKSVEDLDWAYIMEWASELGIRELAEKVRTA